MNGKGNNNVRWVHLSDFHVGKDNYAQRKLFREIIDYLLGLIGQGFSPDLIFVTGDVADKGLIDQYNIFKSEFLAPLIKKLPAEVGSRIFIVPGNHDVFRNTHKYFERREICGVESHFFDPNLEGLNERRQLLPRFESYITSDLPPTSWIDTTQGFFTHRLEINGIDIGIAGINTAS